MTLNKSYLSRLLPDGNPCSTKLERGRTSLNPLQKMLEKKNLFHFKTIAFQLRTEQRCVRLVKQHFYFTDKEIMCPFPQAEK